jgi:hypothetical protein
MRAFGRPLALAICLLGQQVFAEFDKVAVAAKIGAYWNIGAADADTRASTIVVRVSFGRDGKPVDFRLIESEGPSQAGIDMLFAAARRAVLRAHMDGGLPLSEADYDTWRVIDLVFDENGMPLS